MKKIKFIGSLLLITLFIGVGSCGQDDTMDEIIDNTEINAPNDQEDNDGSNTDDPTG